MKVQLTPTREVENFGVPYVIAELGANHNGDMNLAEKLIRAAKEAGADCVKLQSWSKESLFSKGIYAGNEGLEKDIDKYATTEEQMLIMKKIADEVGIDMATSVFSEAEADFAAGVLKAPFIKIASMDVDNYPLLAYVAKKGKPMILSTGLSTLSEIDRAVETIEAAGNTQIVILHCVAQYPPQDVEVNLNNIATYQRLYPYPVGFSDHSLGTAIPLGSVALGVAVIEKHFTLDKNMEGWDHQVSANPEEMRVLCEGGKRIQMALGSMRIVAPEGEDKKQAFRRSWVTTRDIKEGEAIAQSDLALKRPGKGLPPDAARFIVGKTARRAIAKDSFLSLEDF